MEFQAIVLAGGRGTRMDHLTSNTPKCLLPIGNKPMIWYPVRMLEKAGFNEINIITLNSIKQTVEKELKFEYGIKAHLNIVGIDNEHEDEEFGTANALFLLKDKIFYDCIVVSCDLITSLNLQSIVNFFRVKNASFVSVFADVVEQSIELPVPGSKGKYTPERDIVGMDTETNRLLYFGAEADVDEIRLKASVLRKYPKIIWTNKLHDAHLYIVKKWLIEYVIDDKKIFSLKSDLLPFLCKKQFSLNKKQLKEIKAGTNNTTTMMSPGKNKSIKPKLFEYLRQEETSYLINKMASNNLNSDMISVYAYVQADGFCYRNNNLAIYAESNKQIIGKIMPYYQKEKNDSTGKHEKSQMNSDNIIGENSTIGDKTVVKRSVIGRNCKIGEKVKITNSVLMDNVVVSEGVVIQGSILCSSTKINQKSELKDCLIGYNQDIITTGKYSNETIQDVDSFIDDDGTD